MKTFEKAARDILEKHGCKFVEMLSECTVAWENKCGYPFVDDVAVLRLMTSGAWDFWSNYNPV
jgi:pyruvate/2-oxoacid:ferredoxin oxidoreductase beta subunit